MLELRNWLGASDSATRNRALNAIEAKPVRSDPLGFSFQPHTLNMLIGEEFRDGANVSPRGMVDHIKFLGEFSRDCVRAGETVIIVDQPHWPGIAPFALGAIVRLGIDTSQIRDLSIPAD